MTRKRIFNQMEDLKGKIRVYARVRPILPFESAQGQKEALTFPDELSLTMMWRREKREFNFDTVFTPSSTQTQVFEDTKHLVQSAIDGYNVCIFAYVGPAQTQYFVCLEGTLTVGVRQLVRRQWSSARLSVHAMRQVGNCIQLIFLDSLSCWTVACWLSGVT